MTTQQAAAARAAYHDNATTYAEAVYRRMTFEAERPVQKDAAIQRLMQAGEKTSYTAAEKLVESEPEYREFLRQYREAVRTEHLAFAAMEAEAMRHREILAVLQFGGPDYVRLEEVKG